MTHLKRGFVPLLALFLLTAFAPAKPGPQEYHDAIVGEQEKVLRLMDNMGNHLSSDLDKAEQLRGELLHQCNKSVTVLQAMPAYDGDTRLRDACVALLRFYAKVSADEYKEIIDLLRKKEPDIDRMRELQEELFGPELTLVLELRRAQKEFAEKHGL